MKLISLHKYCDLKKEAGIEFQTFLQYEEKKKAKQKEQDGGPNPYLLRLNKNSRLFTRIVHDKNIIHQSFAMIIGMCLMI